MLKLCGFRISNYHNKVRLALLDKGVAFVEDDLCIGPGLTAIKVPRRNSSPARTLGFPVAQRSAPARSLMTLDGPELLTNRSSS